MVQKVPGLKSDLDAWLKNSLCSPSSEWVPDSKELGKVRRREEMGTTTHMPSPRNSGSLTITAPTAIKAIGTFTFTYLPLGPNIFCRHLSSQMLNQIRGVVAHDYPVLIVIMR